ncbi:hypothetical protein AU381_11435 [Sinorhizobium glycinis]|uniref:Uncharacterized protein n=1 Tax=Sinorhizobium glycinis TaxID=1472378 RepID=A0A178XJW6_9HYPH|nr:hypothetical protein AU381_11435 [Sinorhizobium glycinis]
MNFPAILRPRYRGEAWHAMKQQKPLRPLRGSGYRNRDGRSFGLDSQNGQLRSIADPFLRGATMVAFFAMDRRQV